MESKKKLLSNIKCRSIQIFNHQIKDNIVTYTIEIKLNNKQSIIIKERYSELLNLHNAMSKEAKLPNFPPKKYFGNTDENFLNQRQLSLNEYYEIITSSHIYSNLPSFKSWIFSKFKDMPIDPKEKLKYYEYEDIKQEKKRQAKIEKDINHNIIPLFVEINVDSEIDNNYQKKENEYSNLINKEVFPSEKDKNVDGDLIGTNNNFNFIGNKKNNLIKMEKLFNNTLNELNENIKTKCIDKFQAPDLLMKFDL